MNIPWWGYVIMAGLSWGTYVPIIFYGGNELGGKSNARLMAILCVGVAYFVIAVLLPLGLFLSGAESWPKDGRMKTGLTFAALAGVAGAVGAICVIFASKAAMAAGMEAKAADPDFNPASYRMLIAPMIFGLAPVINTILSMFWHPKEGDPLNFGFDFPGPLFIIGIVLIGLGVGLVLYSKESAEEAKKKAPKPAVTAPVDATPATMP